MIELERKKDTASIITNLLTNPNDSEFAKLKTIDRVDLLKNLASTQMTEHYPMYLSTEGSQIDNALAVGQMTSAMFP